MSTLETATEQLASGGAVLRVWNSPAHDFLVGDLRWIDANHLFWFTAHGDREDDGHVLEYDRAELVDGAGVEFYRRDKCVGWLAEIARAEIADHEDYEVAFSLWQQVAPRAEPLLKRSRVLHGVA